MSPVEMQAIQGSLILRARGSELLILAHHVSELKNLKQPKDFTRYFMNDALINRPARKLFEAWLRKDGSLWQRLYSKIQKEMEEENGDTITTKAPVAPKVSAEAPQKAPAKAPAMKAEAEDKPAKKEAKETVKKAAAKEEKKATATKAKPAAKEKTEKPAATKKVAAAKKTTTAAKKKTTAAKSSAGKTTKKKK